MMEAHFIQIGNDIFQLEQVCSAQIHKLSAENAKHFGLAETQVELYMTSGQVLMFTDKDAEQVWGLLKASALNITPRSES